MHYSEFEVCCAKTKYEYLDFLIQQLINNLLEYRNIFFPDKINELRFNIEIW